MISQRINRSARFILTILFCTFGGVALAADVSTQLSQRETYVGAPVILSIRISDASKHEMPKIPNVDGLSIRSLGAPQQSSRRSIVNGRMIEDSSSLTYRFLISPQRAGTFTIPAFDVQADGEKHPVAQQRIIASKSETGDLMFVEIVGKQDSIYVGQSLELTLKIWLRPYRDQEQNVLLSEASMWQTISQQSNWGPFTKRLEDLAGQRRRPGGEEVLREDSEGQQRSYYLYEIEATVYPQKPGEIDADDVQIVVQYPTGLGRTRDPFARFFGDDGLFPSAMSSSLSVTSVRPITAQASVESIEVKPIPTNGRPADYRGAVGRYQIVTEAKPTKVKAGDPITLHIGVAGTGPMELVQAPPLAELPTLTADFKVRDEPLAGFVDGSQKVFSTTIRPRKQGITKIPPIPLSFFDPDAEKFVTVYSDAIAIEVDETETLALDSIVSPAQRKIQSDPDKPDLTNNTFENTTGPELLQSQSPSTIRSLHWSLMALPPLVFLLVQIARHRSTLIARRYFGSSIRRARSQIDSANSAGEVGSALSDYLLTRFRHQVADDNADAVVGVLRRSGNRDLAIRCERLLGTCKRDAYASNERLLVESKQQANELVDELDRSMRRRKLKPNVKRLIRNTATTLTFFVTLLCSTAPAFASRVTPFALNESQQLQLLEEADDIYRLALQRKSTAPADSKTLAEQAANKYQLIVDSGVTNARLHCNLANAYYQSGHSGRAIANYHRALRIDPTDTSAWANLQHVKNGLNAKNRPEKDTTLMSGLSNANAAVSRYIHPRTIGMAAIVCWYVLWLLITMRSLGIQFAWKSLTLAATMLFAVAAASYVHSSKRTQISDRAIIVTQSTELRSGDGFNFDSVGSLENMEGESVKLLHRRGDWVRVETQSGQIGWLSTQVVEVI